MPCGLDMIEIERIEKSIQNKRFLHRVFSAEELALFEERKWKASVVAGNFAAKEAFSKALGTGIRGFSLREVAVLRNALGAPYLSLSGQAANLASPFRFEVSITNTKTMAAAVVIAFPKEDQPCML